MDFGIPLLMEGNSLRYIGVVLGPAPNEKTDFDDFPWEALPFLRSGMWGWRGNRRTAGRRNWNWYVK